MTLLWAWASVLALLQVTPAGGNIAALVQSFADRTPAFTANFEQVSIRARTGRTSRRAGRVRVLRPQRIRWDYTKPEPVHYVTDGKVFWVYQPQDALAYRMNVQHGGLDVAIMILAGRARLESTFKIHRIEAPTGHVPSDLAFIELIPRANPQKPGWLAGTLRKLVLGIDPGSGAVRFSLLVDPDGNEIRTTYHFLQKAPPSKAVFDFHPPPGVRVQDISKGRRDALTGTGSHRAPGIEHPDHTELPKITPK